MGQTVKMDPVSTPSTSTHTKTVYSGGGGGGGGGGLGLGLIQEQPPPPPPNQSVNQLHSPEPLLPAALHPSPTDQLTDPPARVLPRVAGKKGGAKNGPNF